MLVAEQPGIDFAHELESAHFVYRAFPPFLEWINELPQFEHAGRPIHEVRQQLSENARVHLAAEKTLAGILIICGIAINQRRAVHRKRKIVPAQAVDMALDAHKPAIRPAARGMTPGQVDDERSGAPRADTYLAVDRRGIQERESPVPRSVAAALLIVAAGSPVSFVPEPH